MSEQDDGGAKAITVHELEMMQRIANILGNSGYVVLPDCPRCFGEGCEDCDYKGRRVFRSQSHNSD